MKIHFHIFVSLIVFQSVFAGPAFFALSDFERVLQIPEDSTQEYFICSQAGVKVFGKNPANAKDCYSITNTEFSEIVSSFYTNITASERQVGIYQEDGKQVHFEWTEPGKDETYILLNFVISKDRQFFVQCLRKRDKQYFYFKSKREFWKIGGR